MMTTVAEGLVLAIRSLPKADKRTVVALLLEDPDIRESMAENLFGKPVKPVGSREDEYRSRPENGLEAGVTSRQIGKRLRESYVSELQKKGIRIDQVVSVWAKTSAGLWVAIPFATERTPNRWFLGLALHERIRSGGTAVVLLCQPTSGPTLDFLLPPSKVQELVDVLSKSGGPMKFNITKLGSRYHLLIPGRSPLDVSGYKGDLSILQS